MTFSVLGLATESQAADTVEPFAPGEIDYEFYVAVGGIGHRQEEMTLAGESVLGYGIAERFSGYVALSLEGDGYLRGGLASVASGIFGTPLDSSHLDFDLGLELGADGDPGSGIAVVPWLELNLDLNPEMESFGAFLRAGLAVQGSGNDGPSGEGDSSPEVTIDLPSVIGLYLTVAQGHQLLLELEAVWLELFREQWALGDTSLALGYNALLTKGLELIVQVSANLHSAGREQQFPACWRRANGICGFGAMTGLVATLP